MRCKVNYGVFQVALAVGLILLVYGSTGAQDVTCNDMSGADFSEYEIYKSVDAGNTRPNQIVDQLIKRSVDGELAVTDPRKSASVTVKIIAAPSPAPVIQSLKATPATVQAGQSALIQWSVTGASMLELNGVPVASGNSMKVVPLETTTYTLTATNASGAASLSVRVTVQQGAMAGAALGVATVDASRPGIQIPATFMGFAHGWAESAKLMGRPGQTNHIYRQLVRNLLAHGAGPFVIRIGEEGTGEPSATTVAPMAQLATDIGAKFMLGVNLGSNNVQLAVDQTRNDVANMPVVLLEAIEIGNEPDLYARDGRRPSTYTFTDYFADFAKWRAQILPLLPPGLKLMGPSWASTGALSTNLPPFLAQEQNNLSIVSQHYYAGSHCGGKTNPPDYLLQDSAARKGAHAVAPSVTLVHRAGLPFRMGEMNSISCSGEAGVSDTFASALWVLDSLFEFANVGVDGVNLHTNNNEYYALFTFNVATSGRSVTFSVQSIRPEYYGALLFQQATANGARLLPVTLSTQDNLKAWATLDSNGVARVILINKDKTAQGEVSISLPGFGAGVVTRLSAANYQTTSGITIGGQTFDGSADGTLQGTASAEPVTPSGGVYSVALLPTTAALLTIQP